MNQNTQYFKDETVKSFFKNTNNFRILQEFVMLSYRECAVQGRNNYDVTN